MVEAPSISLKKVGKRFGEGPPVLEDISLETGAGAITAVVGPSGCGKSTLLRIVAGLLQADAGEISHSGAQPDTAFIFQDATLLPWATVRDNIILPHRLRGVDRPARDELADEWGRRVGLWKALDLYPRQLSGGMKMRVSIARALSLFPNLLLLDEPFGALDAITRNRLNEELLKLHARARWTALFVTHSVNEAVFLSHRIVIMGSNPGRVSAIIENPLPFPRDAHTRESLEYLRLVGETTARLHETLSA